MPKPFLIGNFLSAYASSYRYAPRETPGQGLSTDRLSDRFATRGQTFRRRKQRYFVRLQVGIAAALLALLGLTRLDLSPGDAFQVTEASQDVIAMEEVVQTVQRVLPPPPPRPPVPVVVPDESVIEDVALDLDASLEIDEPLAALPPPPEPDDEPVEEEPEQDIFVVVETMPEIIGGWGKLAKAVKYPPIAQQAEIEGVVVVQVVINEDGTPSDPEVLRTVSDVLNQAAIDAILKQRFTPGMQRGHAVRVRMAIPVTFRLT